MCHKLLDRTKNSGGLLGRGSVGPHQIINLWLFPFHRVLQGAPPRGRRLYFTFPSAQDPLFKASKAPFLTLRVATPSGAPRGGANYLPKFLPISFFRRVSRFIGVSGLVLHADHALDFLSDLGFQACISFYSVLDKSGA